MGNAVIILEVKFHLTEPLSGHHSSLLPFKQLKIGETVTIILKLTYFILRKFIIKLT